MIKLWAVCGESPEAWEPGYVLSIWTTKEGAEAERDRLIAGGSALTHNDKISIAEITPDVASDEQIRGCAG